jgi:hypothetical protein
MVFARRLKSVATRASLLHLFVIPKRKRHSGKFQSRRGRRSYIYSSSRSGNVIPENTDAFTTRHPGKPGGYTKRHPGKPDGLRNTSSRKTRRVCPGPSSFQSRRGRRSYIYSSSRSGNVIPESFSRDEGVAPTFIRHPEAETSSRKTRMHSQRVIPENPEGLSGTQLASVATRASLLHLFVIPERLYNVIPVSRSEDRDPVFVPLHRPLDPGQAYSAFRDDVLRKPSGFPG